MAVCHSTSTGRMVPDSLSAANRYRLLDDFRVFVGYALKCWDAFSHPDVISVLLSHPAASVTVRETAFVLRHFYSSTCTSMVNICHARENFRRAKKILINHLHENNLNP